MKLTDIERLRLASHYLEGDTAFDADCIALNKKATPKEKSFARLITDLYRLIHPRFSSCGHLDWERESVEKLKRYEKTKKN